MGVKKKLDRLARGVNQDLINAVTKPSKKDYDALYGSGLVDPNSPLGRSIRGKKRKRSTRGGVIRPGSLADSVRKEGLVRKNSLLGKGLSKLKNRKK